jgi:hypothetical protein
VYYALSHVLEGYIQALSEVLDPNPNPNPNPEASPNPSPNPDPNPNPNPPVSILASGHWIVQDLVPRAVKVLEKRLGRPSGTFRELSRLQQRLAQLQYRLQDLFARRFAFFLLRQTLDWSLRDYHLLSHNTTTSTTTTTSTALADSDTVSYKFVRVLAELARVRTSVQSALLQRSAGSILTAVLEHLFALLSLDKSWSYFSSSTTTTNTTNTTTNTTTGSGSNSNVFSAKALNQLHLVSPSPLRP